MPPLPQYAFVVWRSVKKARGQIYLLLYFTLICILHQILLERSNQEGVVFGESRNEKCIRNFGLKT